MFAPWLLSAAITQEVAPAIAPPVAVETLSDAERYDRIVQCRAAVIIFRQTGTITRERNYQIMRMLYVEAYALNAKDGMSWETSVGKLNVDSSLAYTDWQFKHRKADFLRHANAQYKLCFTLSPSLTG